MTDGLSRARRLLAEVLDMETGEIGADASIGTLEAWDSLAHMRLILAVEDMLGRQLDPEALVEIAGVMDIAAILEAEDGRGGETTAGAGRA